MEEMRFDCSPRFSIAVEVWRTVPAMLWISSTARWMTSPPWMDSCSELCDNCSAWVAPCDTSPMLTVTCSTVAAIDEAAALWWVELVATWCDDSDSMCDDCATFSMPSWMSRKAFCRLPTRSLKERAVWPSSSVLFTVTRRVKSPLLLISVIALRMRPAGSDTNLRRMKLITIQNTTWAPMTTATRIHTSFLSSALLSEMSRSITEAPLW
jgi:hypothetical protein